MAARSANGQRADMRREKSGRSPRGGGGGRLGVRKSIVVTKDSLAFSALDL
jgi:hypothetical protein